MAEPPHSKPAKDLETGACIQTWQVHDGLVTSISMASDGNKVCTTSRDGQVGGWQSFKTLRRLPWCCRIWGCSENLHMICVS